MSARPVRWTSESATRTGPGARPSLTALPALPHAGRPPFPAEVPHPRPTHEQDEISAAGFATFPLTDDPVSPATARSHTRATLRGWGLGALADDACVIVSELVTNALRYGSPNGSPLRPLPPTETEPFLLSMVHHDRSVLCAVFDPGTDIPVVKDPDYFMESGRGLHVLESLSQSWGWTTPDRHGKAVWALLPASPPPPVAARTAATSSGAASEPLTRLLLLLELLSGPSWLKMLGAPTRGAIAERPE